MKRDDLENLKKPSVFSCLPLCIQPLHFPQKSSKIHKRHEKIYKKVVRFWDPLLEPSWELLGLSWEGLNKSKKGNRAKGNKGRQVNQIHWNLRLQHSSDILTLSALLQHHSSQTALLGKICDSAKIAAPQTKRHSTNKTR